MSLINELREERMRNGVSQTAIAAAMGTTQSALSRAERNGNPTQDFLQRYRAALDSLTHTESTLEIATVRLLAADIAKAFDISELYVYGSVARGQADADSDVDMLYRWGSGGAQGLFSLVRLRERLEEALKRQVSLLSFDALEHDAEHSIASRRFLNHIRPELVRVI